MLDTAFSLATNENHPLVHSVAMNALMLSVCEVHFQEDLNLDGLALAILSQLFEEEDGNFRRKQLCIVRNICWNEQVVERSANLLLENLCDVGEDLEGEELAIVIECIVSIYVFLEGPQEDVLKSCIEQRSELIDSSDGDVDQKMVRRTLIHPFQQCLMITGFEADMDVSGRYIEFLSNEVVFVDDSVHDFIKMGHVWIECCCMCRGEPGEEKELWGLFLEHLESFMQCLLTFASYDFEKEVFQIGCDMSTLEAEHVWEFGEENGTLTAYLIEEVTGICFLFGILGQLIVIYQEEIGNYYHYQR